MDLNGAKIGEKPQLLTEQEQAILRAGLRQRIIPFGTTDGPQKHGITLFTDINGGGGDGLTFFIDSDTADMTVSIAELVAILFSNRIQDLDGFSGHLRSDPITG